MKREIKFRAWANEFSSTNYVMIENYCFLGESNHFMAEDLVNDRPCVGEIHSVMQFTGLLDKNGKDIYEGDILMCGYGRGEVIYNAGCFMISWIDDVEANMELIGFGKNMRKRTHDAEFEIIGNIHEVK